MEKGNDRHGQGNAHGYSQEYYQKLRDMWLAGFQTRQLLSAARRKPTREELREMQDADLAEITGRHIGLRRMG